MFGGYRVLNMEGKLVFVGHTKLTVEFDNPLFHSREMTIIASRPPHTTFIACPPFNRTAHVMRKLPH